MKKIHLTFLFIVIYTFIFGQEKELKLGSYYSVDNKFEKWSVLNILKENRFVYKYGQGGCQGEITGNWKINGKYLELENDSKFIYDETKQKDLLKLNDTLKMEIPQAFYPNLGKTKWKIKRNSLKPMNEIETGCFNEIGKHKLKK